MCNVRRRAFLLSVFLTAFVQPQPAPADNLWTNPAGGTWSDPANWSPAIPTWDVGAIFNLGPSDPASFSSYPGYTLSLPGATVTGSFLVQHDNINLDLQTHLFTTYDGGMGIATAPGQLASLQISNGQSDTPTFGLSIGTNGGNGTLTASQDALLTSRGVTVGAGRNVSPSLTDLGPATGTLLLQQNAQLACTSIFVGSTGGVGVLNAVSPQVHIDTAALTIGSYPYSINALPQFDTAAGTVNLTNGATLHLGTATFAPGNIAVGTRGGNGALNLDGPGTSFTTGNLDLTFASFSIGTYNYGSYLAHGAVSVTNAATLSYNGPLICGSYGGTGTLAVDGAGSSASFAAQSFIGYNFYPVGPAVLPIAPSVGQASVTNGAHLSFAALTVGSIGAQGFLTVDGATSQLAATQLKIGADRYIIQNTDYGPGTGSLLLTGGARATIDGDIFIAYLGAVGSATVKGNGTLLSSTSAGLNVGYGQSTFPLAAPSIGTLDLRDGAAISVNNFHVGEFGGVGAVTLDGTGTSLSSHDTSIGSARLLSPTGADLGPAVGSLTISHGAHLSDSTDTYIGSDGGTGSLLLTDPGSLLSAQNLHVGLQTRNGFPAQGSLTIANGATLMTIQATLGANAAIGTVSLTGPGTSWHNANEIHLGASSFAGVGNLSVSAGASVQSDDALRIYPGSSLSLAAGSITTPYVINDGSLTGNGTLVATLLNSASLSPASLSIVGDLSLTSPSTLTLNLLSDSLYGHLDSIHTLTFGGSLLITLDPSFLPAPGTIFHLFDFTSTTPNSSFFNLSLPALPPNVFWDTSSLYSAGTLTVLPDPALPALLFPLTALLLPRFVRKS